MTNIKLVIVLFCSVLGLASAADKQWWETASFYQIYPRSFKDSDGDGIGDLNGITEQLPYLKEIGVTATWLSPIFVSPMADFGYDIANFFDIEPIFGTMADFDRLIEKANQIGMKIIVDFVPNHSSDECEWFIKSVNGDPEYKDFYIWHPGKIVNGTRVPPTNWISYFRGSQWTWNEKRQEYYLHQFHTKQPEFNYRNPKVRDTMEEILTFWMNKGVAGFRVDAVNFLYETAPDASGNLPDEPRNPEVDDPLDYMSLLHVHTTNLPETTEMVYEFRRILDRYNAEHGGDERILMTEAYAPINILMDYYGTETDDGAQVSFNFEIINDLKNTSDAYHYDEIIHRWLDNLPEGRVANWVLGNHDRKRVGTRMNSDRIDMMNMLLFSLPGCAITYYGEEIGMTDVFISWEETVDPQGCQSNPIDFERLSRDPVRTPMQWNDKKLGGFTEGNVTWLPVAKDAHLVNVKRQRGIAMSHLNLFKQMQNVRKAPAFTHGDSEVKALSENILAVKRWYEGDYIYVTLLNINDNVESVNLHAAFSDLTSTMEYIVLTEKSPRRIGDLTHTNSVLLMPKEAVVLRTAKKL